MMALGSASVFHLHKVWSHSSLEMSRRYANLVTADQQSVHQRGAYYLLIVDSTVMVLFSHEIYRQGFQGDLLRTNSHQSEEEEAE
jgi:hypothetical protein